MTAAFTYADWKEGVEPGDYYVCNSIWVLTDFTENNGATRVVPRSHNSRQHPRDVLEDAKAPHPDQVLLTAEAGTVVIFNAHTWLNPLFPIGVQPDGRTTLRFARILHPQRSETAD